MTAVAIEARSAKRLISLPEWFVRVPKLPLVVMVGFVAVGIFADRLAPLSPYDQNITDRLLPPSWLAGGTGAHFLGTDSLGRDSLSRLILGTRVTLIVAVAALAVGGAAGLVVGMLAGYFGGRVDAVLMRLTDAAMALPGLFLALLLAVLMRPSFSTVIIGISLVIWARFVRVLRAEVLKIKEADFVKLARVAGCSNRSIMVHHIFPNLVNTWVILLSLELGAVVIFEATLGFLGAGVPPPTPSWGSLVSDGRQYAVTQWWLSFFPGLAITLVVLSVNMLGDWMRDMLDPKMRQKGR